MRQRHILALSALASITVATAQTCPTIAWEDEFDGNALNTTKWSFQNGDGCAEGICGWGNNEKEWYQEDNAAVGGGILTITARFDAQAALKYRYTSAKILTRDLAAFGPVGRFEARIKLPGGGQGIWPAFWMLPTDEVYGGWPQSGEIDIMENIGREPKTIHGTIHYGDLWPYNSYEGSGISLPTEYNQDFADNYHVFAIEREDNIIRWLLDDVVYLTITDADISTHTWPFNEEFFFILNVAIGGNWPGDPDDTTVFPTAMEVDYVRVWNGNLPTLAGSQVVNEGASGVSYSILNSLADATYTWTVPADADIASGQGTSSVSVDFGTMSGSVSVTVESSSCGFGRGYAMYVAVATPSPTPAPCGCSTCTQDVLGRIVTGTSTTASCGARISWSQTDRSPPLSEYDACVLVAETEFPDPDSGCGPCNPNACNNTTFTPQPTPQPTHPTPETPTQVPTKKICHKHMQGAIDACPSSPTNCDNNNECSGQKICWTVTCGETGPTPPPVPTPPIVCTNAGQTCSGSCGECSCGHTNQQGTKTCNSN